MLHFLPNMLLSIAHNLTVLCYRILPIMSQNVCKFLNKNNIQRLLYWSMIATGPYAILNLRIRSTAWLPLELIQLQHVLSHVIKSKI